MLLKLIDCTLTPYVALGIAAPLSVCYVGYPFLANKDLPEVLCPITLLRLAEPPKFGF